MAKIKQVFANQILDSNGQPAIETGVVLSDGSVGISSSPTGISVSKYEAIELRDNDKQSFQGLGVQNAILNIENVIAPSILGLDAHKQHEIDRKIIALDGTQNKARLGANATLSVSMAVSKASARSAALPLFVYLREYIKKDNLPLKIPTPAFSLINGGKHGIDNNVNFQDFLLIPASSKSYADSLNIGGLVSTALKNLLQTANHTTLSGDEGGFSPKLSNNMEGLEYLKKAIETVSLRLGFDVFIGVDAAANSFFANGKYRLKDKTSDVSASDLISFYETMNKDYHLLYLEDPLSEDDWEGWNLLYQKLSQQTLIIGDDLTATNPYRIQTALEKKTITGVVIKPNQIGTVIEALAVVEVARQAGLKIIVSGRSGETNDDFIADFSVAVTADYVKFGGLTRGERVAKYNRLSQIQKQLKSLQIK